MRRTTRFTAPILTLVLLLTGVAVPCSCAHWADPRADSHGCCGQDVAVRSFADCCCTVDAAQAPVAAEPGPTPVAVVSTPPVGVRSGVAAPASPLPSTAASVVAPPSPPLVLRV